MAKGSLFVGSGSGKVGNLVLANTKSGQVTRAYQPNVANPKTRMQMLQRARFANAVKFFKQAVNGFFRFAYEDKTKRESDYNAFMRHNIKVSLPLSRELYNSIAVPAIGNAFLMSGGRLSNPAKVSFATKTTPVDGGPADDLTISLPGAAAASTIGAVSKVLIDGGLQAGDIITIVRIGSELTLATAQDATAFDDAAASPQWSIYQIVLDVDNETPLSDIPCVGHGASDGKRALNLSDDKTELSAVYADGKSQWGCMVVTRKAENTLYASNSYLVGDSVSNSIVGYLQQESTIDNALLSWGSKGEIILRGSIAG